MAIGDIIEVRVGCYLDPQAAYNVRHYGQFAGSAAPVPLQLAAGSIAATLHQPYKALLSTPAEFVGVGVRRIFPGPPSAEDADTSQRGVGSAGPGPLPSQTSGILSIRSVLPGRRFRGRLYIPFPAELDNDVTGLPAQSYLTRANNLASALQDIIDIVDGPLTWNLQPVVWSRTSSLAADVESMVPRARWATQRRRGAFGRPNPVPFS